MDESYFGGHRKGKRSRGAAGKVPIFDLLKPGEKIYAVIIPDAYSETFMDFIEEKVTSDSIVYTDCFHVYDGLGVSDFHHLRLNYLALFAGKQNHINRNVNF